MAFVFLGIPLTIFVLFVLPIWLWLYYNSQRGSRAGEFETRRLAALAENAQQMEARIKTLEAILDAENPGWRQS